MSKEEKAQMVAECCCQWQPKTAHFREGRRCGSDASLRFRPACSLFPTCAILSTLSRPTYARVRSIRCSEKSIGVPVSAEAGMPGEVVETLRRNLPAATVAGRLDAAIA